MKTNISTLKKEITKLSSDLSKKKSILHQDYAITKNNLIPISGLLIGGIITWFLISKKSHKQNLSPNIKNAPKQSKFPINSLLKLALIPVVRTYLNTSFK